MFPTTLQKDEIIKCIQKLKNIKAGGEDAIINEYIKTTSNQFIEIYEKLFNLIFDTGFIPESWVVDIYSVLHLTFSHLYY
jgi:methionyl-tRNA synthetase